MDFFFEFELICWMGVWVLEDSQGAQPSPFLVVGAIRNYLGDMGSPVDRCEKQSPEVGGSESKDRQRSAARR